MNIIAGWPTIGHCMDLRERIIVCRKAEQLNTDIVLIGITFYLGQSLIQFCCFYYAELRMEVNLPAFQ